MTLPEFAHKRSNSVILSTSDEDARRMTDSMRWLPVVVGRRLAKKPQGSQADPVLQVCRLRRGASPGSRTHTGTCFASPARSTHHGTYRPIRETRCAQDYKYEYSWSGQNAPDQRHFPARTCQTICPR